MPYDRGTNSTTASHDEKLTDIDQRRKAATHDDHHPSIRGHVGEHWDLVHDGDGKHQHHAADRRLVQKELGGRHGEFLVISPDEHGVSGRSTDTSEGEENADAGCGGDLLASPGGGRFGLSVVVGGYSYADADGDEDQRCVAGDCRPVESIVDYGGHGCQEHPAELVDCDCAES